MSRLDLEVEVTSLGAGGDGIAETADGRLFIPYAAPGDTLRVRLPEKPGNPLRGKIVERVRDGADRQESLCSHFSTCGGCAVQHIGAAAYAAWKQNLVRDALSHRGIEPAVVAEMVPGGVGRRRRARFHARSMARGARRFSGSFAENSVNYAKPRSGSGNCRYPMRYRS
jgi:23S rRNA (uracil1939-C5)-methyltransferase